jgi:stage IV sporulation protein FB
VFLAEPPPTQGDVRFSLLGFPVRIHPLFWLMSLLLGMNLPPAMFMLWIPAVVLCILLHELGHALVMRAYGYEAAIVLYSFGGLAIPRGRKLSARQPGPWGQILISMAGPGAGFVLAALLAAALQAIGWLHVHFPDGSLREFMLLPMIPNHPYIDEFLFFVFQITIWWGVINLLPIFPLDGGQIAHQVFTLLHPPDAMRNALILSVIIGGLISFVAFVQWKDWYLGILFVWLTYSNFSALQSARAW